MRKIAMALFVAILIAVGAVSAVTTCTFTTVGTTMKLDTDCTTDTTISIPNGFTLVGQGNTITAVDPVIGHFVGAVVKNEGAVAHVKNLRVTASGLANICDGSGDRLRGIMFDEASGSIIDTVVLSINQGASGCQEGNAIEVRSAPFDGTHPDTKKVIIKGNYMDDWQKTGIVANGDVNVDILNNNIGDSATQSTLAANSVQFGYGGTGVLMHNNIIGNQWLGTSDYAATAVLIYLADNVKVSQNNIRGNSDVGIYIYGDKCSINNNKVFDEGVDGTHGDYGISNFGVDNVVTNNKIKGFEVSYEGVIDGKNKIIPGPQPGNEFW